MRDVMQDSSCSPQHLQAEAYTGGGWNHQSEIFEVIQASRSWSGEGRSEEGRGGEERRATVGLGIEVPLIVPVSAACLSG